MDKLLMPAFAEPVHAAQQVFRHALKALSEPGLIQDVGDVPGLDCLAPATYALCLSLLDSDAPLWLSPSLDTPLVRSNLIFHCGCPVVDQPQQAAFAILDGSRDTDISAFNTGSDRDPHLSCTILLQLDSLDSGAATLWRGPGILDKRAVRLPLPSAFWAQRAQQPFPQGLDVFMTSGSGVMGLPRSTKIFPTIQEVI